MNPARLDPTTRKLDLDRIQNETFDIAIIGGGVVNAHTIDEHQHMVGFRTPHPQLGLRTWATGLVDGKAWHGAQHVGQVRGLHGGQFSSIDNGY